MNTLPESPDTWRRCSSCKKPIVFKTKYWVCNVSTCTRKRTGLVFCDVSCWDAHVPGMNHRESWAEERKAPSREEWAAILAKEAEPKKRTPKAPTEAKPVESPADAGPPKVILRRARTD